MVYTFLRRSFRVADAMLIDVEAVVGVFVISGKDSYRCHCC
jgi:hypothetical protein